MNTRAICLFIHLVPMSACLFRARSISIYISLSHPSQISNGSLDHTYHLPLPSRLRENQRESDLSGLKQIAGCVKGAWILAGDWNTYADPTEAVQANA